MGAITSAPNQPPLLPVTTSVPIPECNRKMTPKMTQEAGRLDKQTLEEALRDALKSLLGGTGLAVNPRAEFYNKFQREMEEHDRDFEKKYDEDLNTTLIFSGLFSAVTSAFIIDVQSELKPDYMKMWYEYMDPEVETFPQWPGPDPVVVQVQCLLYATLSATLLASFLAMLGKQWLNRYRQNEVRGSVTDRCRVRERKLSGVETWKFHIVVESLPLILQCALALLAFALSRYLRGVNRPVSSVVIGFTSFGFLFYLLITMASVFSFNCPFQTPFSLLARFVIGLAVPPWRNFRQTFGPKKQPPQPGMQGARHDLPFSVNTVDRGDGSEANMTTPTCLAPAVVQFPWSITPLFAQRTGTESDRLDARCISRMLAMSTDTDVAASIMDFIPEIIWHGGIKNVPLKRIYDILMDCFDLSGPSPVVIPRLRDVAYLSARAFAHIELQRRCITQHEEHDQNSWKALCANHPFLSPTEYGPDSDLGAALFMVDMTLGCDSGFPWDQTEMTPPHHAWMSHVLLYSAWHEGLVSGVVMDFVEHSMSLRPPSDIVVTDCLFIIGLMVGVPLHVSDVTVKDKSREKNLILRKIFQVLSSIFSSKSVRPPSALRALRLVTRLAAVDVSDASYKLFKVIMVYDGMADQDWAAARLAIHGTFQGVEMEPSNVGEPKEILRFLDHHICLHVAGEDHGPSIVSALRAIVTMSDNLRADPLTSEWIRNFSRSGQSFANGVRSIMHPDNSFELRWYATGLIALISDQWFDSSVPVMESEISELCEYFAVFVIDHAFFAGLVQRWSVNILFGMLRSPAWRKHVATRFWGVLAHCTLVDEERESFKWCLRNALELLEFARGSPDGERLKWWYGTLWFHYDKLDTTVRDEVEKIARDMSLGDGISDLNLYLNLIGQEVAKKQQEVDEYHKATSSDMPAMELRARLTLIALEGNYDRLARITGGRR